MITITTTVISHMMTIIPSNCTFIMLIAMMMTNHINIFWLRLLKRNGMDPSSLPQGVNPTVGNLSNNAFLDSLLGNILVWSNSYSVLRTLLPAYRRKADKDGSYTTSWIKNINYLGPENVEEITKEELLLFSACYH